MRVCECEGCANEVVGRAGKKYCSALCRGRQKARNNPEGRKAAVAKYRANNPDAQKAASKRYRNKHPERLQAYRDNNREQRADYNRRWRAANPERHAANGARWQADNKERKAATNAVWYSENKDRKAAQAAVYYAENREKIKARQAAYKRENPDVQRAAQARRRARKASAVFQSWVRRTDHDDALCYWCGSSDVAHVDHVMPISLGGPATESNEVPSCADCNLQKHAKHPLVWIAELIERA